jgi:hypothetical protein
MIAYTVTAEFDDETVARQWIDWLRNGHLAEVIAGGALDAEIVRFDREAASGVVICEVRYHFATRGDFARYERDHAPRLRAEGLKHFPPERGVRYRRSVGEVAGVVNATNRRR